MGNPHGSFVWYELVTPDPDASKVFYDSVVGWEIAPQATGEIDYRMIETPDGAVGGVLRLNEAMQAGGGRPGWLGYIGVDDVDATISQLTEAGGSVTMPAFDMPGVGRLALVADPQGVPFYLMRGTSAYTSTAFAPERTGHCAWNELSTPDPAGAIELYGTLFGWTTDGGMPMGEMGDYVFLAHDGQQVGAVMTAPAEGPPPAWTYYFLVEDIAGAPVRIAERGGTVVHGPADVPGDMQIVVGVDPHGAIFALVGKA